MAVSTRGGEPAAATVLHSRTAAAAAPPPAEPAPGLRLQLPPQLQGAPPDALRSGAKRSRSHFQSYRPEQRPEGEFSALKKINLSCDFHFLSILVFSDNPGPLLGPAPSYQRPQVGPVAGNNLKLHRGGRRGGEHHCG